VSVLAIKEKWHDLGLPEELFHELLLIGNLTGDIEWLKFFAIACSSLVEVGPLVFSLVLCVISQTWLGNLHCSLQYLLTY